VSGSTEILGCLTSWNLFGVAEGDLDIQALAAAEDGEGDDVAGVVGVHGVGEILRGGDLLAVEGDDEIAAEHDLLVAVVSDLVSAAKASLGCGAVGEDALDEDAVVGGEADLLGDVRADGEGDDVERRAAGVAVFFEVVEDALGGVDGDGKADAGGLLGAAVGVGGDEGGDADDLAARVEERAAGVAGVDGGVGLDGVFDLVAGGHGDGADSGDNAAGHGPAEAEGVADGIDALADDEVGGVGEDGGLEVGNIVDLEEGEVVVAVDVDDGGFVLAAVGEGDLDGLGVVDDVIVGEDVALLVEDEAASLPLLGDGTEEEVAAGEGGAGDVDDGGQGAFVDGDVLLLFGVECGGGVGLGEGEVAYGALGGGDGCAAGGYAAMQQAGEGAHRHEAGGEVIEAGKNQKDE